MSEPVGVTQALSPDSQSRRKNHEIRPWCLSLQEQFREPQRWDYKHLTCNTTGTKCARQTRNCRTNCVERALRTFAVTRYEYKIEGDCKSGHPASPTTTTPAILPSKPIANVESRLPLITRRSQSRSMILEASLSETLLPMILVRVASRSPICRHGRDVTLPLGSFRDSRSAHP